MYSLHEITETTHWDRVPVCCFLQLPKDLYSPKTCPQNEQTERALLAGTHPLSSDFTFKAFVVYQENACASQSITHPETTHWDRVLLCDSAGDTTHWDPVPVCCPACCARFALTIYPGDRTLYVGFFECVNEQAAAKFVFDFIHNFAREQGFTRVVGPVDASFWIGYRLKVNTFDKPPYYGEPYNKDYYLGLFEANGYSVAERYLSNQYRRAPLFLPDTMQYRARLEKAEKSDYLIKSLSPKTFDVGMDAVYDLITELYSDFPVYKSIDRQAFRALFSDLRFIVDYRMLKLAFLDGQPVGFLIGVPDYGVLLNRPLSKCGKLKVLAKRLRSSNYIMLYIGVKPEHRGLGKAIAQTGIKEIYLKHACNCIALTKQERSPSTYISSMIDYTSEYVLLEKAVV